MDLLPLFFDLKGKDVLVVGGGEVALRKAGMLIRAGAVVEVVAHEILPDLAEAVAAAGGQNCIGDYSAGRLQGKTLVVAATDDDILNRQVSEDAKAANVPVNVVDCPALCTFVFPAIVDRSPLVAAISSGGASPVLARMLRAKLETTIPAAFGELAELLGAHRDKVKAKFSHINRRREFWEDVLEGPVAELALSGQMGQAKKVLQEMLDAPAEDKQVGEVYLVGAGPGDPDLLTFKALRLMQKADVVLYDRLVSEPILDMCRRDAKRIYVGKARSDHAVPQDEINQRLIDLAKEGHRVLRLKGGDPFIFGRGGEEIAGLAAEGIPFQVVPGITAAAGCAAYSGIPLTHRDYAQSVRFVTGHLKDNSTDLPWSELVHPHQTVVFYMGLMGLPVICQQLQAHGMSADMPIALVQKGTTKDHKVVIGTLSTMVEIVKNQQVVAPTLIIVGEVVKLHQTLSWYNNENS